jgi:Zn-dependent metalloprotease
MRYIGIHWLLSLSTMVWVGCGGESADDPIATVPVHHMETGLAPVGGDLAAAAQTYVLARAGELGLGLSAGDRFAVLRISAADGIQHIRLQQEHRGLPVIGSEIVVHAGDVTFLGFDGYATGHLDGLPLTPSLSEADALAAARQEIAGGASAVFAEETIRLVILPDRAAGARLAWHAQLFDAGGAGVPAGRWNLFLDAGHGAVIERYNAVALAIEQGSGPGGNLAGDFMWQEELDVSEIDGDYLMRTGKLATLDGANGAEPFRAAELTGFMDRAGNNAHGYTEITLTMMLDWMGRRSIDGQGLEVVSQVHDATLCPGNACWAGDRIYYDDAAYTDAIDLVAHEIGHGFTAFHANLAYTASESGALNESFSDVVGVAAEHYREGAAADLLIGEDALPAAALRNLCDPASDGSSINHASEAAAGLAAHQLSGVPNRAFCLAVGRFVAMGMSTVDAVRALGDVWFTANAAYWTSGATYQDGCLGTQYAARALGHGAPAQEALTASWADVGVECGSVVFACNGDGVCDVHAGETCASCADCGSCWQVCGAWHLALCREGLADCGECENYQDSCGDGHCDGDETDASCGQDCGCAELACEADVAPFGCACDESCEEHGDCCADYYQLCE